MISKLTILEMGDIHLGHRRTSTEHIVNNLNKVIDNDAVMQQVDLMIIAGDLFDRLLPLSNPDVSLCHRWIHKLFTVCKRHDITLRVLEGTPSHDNKQPSMMMDVLHASELDIDFKYVDVLSIEYIQKFDISVLYIPDEWNPSCEQTLAEVKTVLDTHGLSQVDFAVMHGQFDVQLPEHLRKVIPHHDSQSYLELVKYLIFIGHVHTASRHDRILAAGSFDRLAHGEEADKGCYLVTVTDSGTADVDFLVTKDAKKYLTYDYQGEHTAVAIEELRERLEVLPEDSYVRIRLNSNDPLAQAVSRLSEEYPLIHINIITEKVTKTNKAETLLAKPTMVTLRIDKLPQLIAERIEGKYDKDLVNDVSLKMTQLVELHNANRTKRST